MPIVIVNGVKHTVATVAEARALAGVDAKPKQTWASEADGRCNRCLGTGETEVGFKLPDGGWCYRCFRCKGSGVAPGHKAKAVDPFDLAGEPAEEWGAGKVNATELMAAEPKAKSWWEKPEVAIAPEPVAAPKPKAKRTRKPKLVSYERS